MGKHKITLQNVVDTRRYLSGLINRVENGSLESKRGWEVNLYCKYFAKSSRIG